MDSAWRGLIRGEVHDPSAYFLGGISGNAGLFSNSIDLAKFMQAMLNCGRDDYDGFRLFKPETVKKFTEVYYTERNTSPNHRGLGFDKPHGNNVYQGAPASLFGHSGFTGTWLWADPESNMVFVFLSNRTYPNDQVNLLAKKGWRGKILSTVVGSW
jgi:CubicO group peptidase (beta-lactamase class C family)